MFKTEDEAKGCWCPFIRVEGSNAFYENGKAIRPKCIGSECMMWRRAVNFNDPEPIEKFYCGLGGKP